MNNSPGCSLGAMVICLAALVSAPLTADAVEIDFTRHLRHYAPEPGSSMVYLDNFSGQPGNARVIVTSAQVAFMAAIELNGENVVQDARIDAATPLEVPVMLLEGNALEVRLADLPSGSLTVRVKQVADVELHVTSRVHFNTNVSDFAAARAFYGLLGFETLTGFPDTNTLEMARAIGIDTPTSYDGSQGETAGGYLLHGELIGVGGFRGGLIDLIEFTIPRNEDPPYARLNHLGMARAAMYTTNIDADYAYMKQAGVAFTAPPTARVDGTRFAIFRDPDGTFYELIERAGEDQETDTTHIVGLGPVNVNVSDFERSLAWYRMLGYKVTQKLPATDSLAVANAMGFDEKVEIDGALLTHPADDSTLELVQWLSPYDSQSAYPLPVNHLGIHRMAFSTTDIAADVAALKAQGVEFVSEVTPCCSGQDSWGSIVAFYDPDGVIVELVEQPWLLDQLMRFMRWLFT